MIIRRTRIAALVLLGLILGAAALSTFAFGADHPLPGALGGSSRGLTVGSAAAAFSAHALFWSLVFEVAWRPRRWRRNVVRAGSVYATAWLSSLLLILAIEGTVLLSAAGYRIDRDSTIAAVLGLILVARANFLPKSRPAWFNGVALPVFAGEADIWRRVHRFSAFRLLAIGIVALLLAALPLQGIDRTRWVMLLLVAELAIATSHALWLGGHRRSQAI